MEPTARSDVPKTLQTIAYISIPNSADLEFLLWDLQDAIAAYAQLSGTALPRPVDLKANDAGSVADGIVLAIEDVADDETLTAIEQALERFGGTERASMPRFEPHKRALSRRVGPPFACTRHVSAMTNCGVAALPSAPAAASQRFVAPRAWASCADRFRKRWTSSWAAVRMGCSVKHAQRLGGGNAANVDADGMVCAEPAVPAPIWRAF